VSEGGPRGHPSAFGDVGVTQVGIAPVGKLIEGGLGERLVNGLVLRTTPTDSRAGVT
jgi:hypothetical protein